MNNQMVSKSKMVLITILLMIFCFKNGMTNVNNDSTKYTKNFIFTDGIYLGFMSWKKNNPITLDNIITEEDKTDKEFYHKLLAKLIIRYYDENGEPKTVDSRNIFGYCRSNTIFTRKHIKINIIGSICHYTETKSSLDEALSEDFVLISMGMGYLPMSQGGEKMHSFIIDFEKNKCYEFNRRSFEYILKRDKALYKMYKNTKGRRKVKMYEYLLKYNEKYPIYFL